MLLSNNNNNCYSADFSFKIYFPFSFSLSFFRHFRKKEKYNNLTELENNNSLTLL